MKLLFVENHATFAAVVVARFLADHAVTVTPSIAGALAALDAARFDAVLVDYDLNDGKGATLVRALRERDARIAVIAVSSHEHGNVELMRAGADGVCSKLKFADIEGVLALVTHATKSVTRHRAPSTMTTPRLHLVDINPVLVAHWRDAFAGLPGVSVAVGDILAVARCALVSPANSYGHMDGGIDRAYSAFFGPHVQRAVYDRVARRPEGFIPVGAAEIIPTGDARVPWLVVAPTMQVPEQVDPAHCYRALRAALRAIARDAPTIDEVYCPGLATGVGCVPERDAAHAMADAYRASLAAASTAP